MTRPLLALIAGAIVIAGSPRIAARPILEPYVFDEGFEKGSVGSWSSYPPAQDTGYDPTIVVGPTRGDRPGLALYREVVPTHESDHMFGVRKHLGIHVSASSVLSFACYVKSNRDIAGVRVRFGFADGSTAERTVGLSARSEWRAFNLAMTGVVPPGRPKKLDAIAFMAIVPKADPENLLRFGLDDVRIDGYRDARWEFTAPRVHVLDEWAERIAATHFTEGTTLIISARPPSRVDSASAVLSRALTGEEVGTFPMTRHGDEWSVSLPLDRTTGIAAGMWRATLRSAAQDAEDATSETDLVFLVKRRDAPATSPRLLIRPGDAPAILKRASSGRMRAIWEDLENRARQYRASRASDSLAYNLDAYDDVFWLPTYVGYVQAIRAPASDIRANAVVYGLSGDPDAGDAARRALLQVSRWPSYVHPHVLKQGQFTYWPVGQMLADLAIGFDMTRDRFSPADRRVVADALLRKGVTEVFKEYVRDNRVSSNTSNWIADVTGGGILSALAVLDDVGDEALEPYLTGMLLKLKAYVDAAFGEDSGYGEGFAYLNHAMQCLNTVLPALDHTFGIEFPDRLAHGHRLLAYQVEPSTRTLLDFGDSTDRLPEMSNFAYLIARYRDPYLKWLYDLAPGRSDVDLLLMDDSVPAKSPEGLPKAVAFRDVGTAVFRSGFGVDDFVFLFRAGPFFNHQHFDQGSFQLRDRGERFLGEAGPSDYYADPWYQKLVIQAAGHNTVLLDRNPRSQRAGDFRHDVPAWRDRAAITDFLAFEGGAFATGRLDPVYDGKLAVLRRNVLYVAPRTVVLIDEAAGADGPHEIDLLFHAPLKESIRIDGRTASITMPAGTLKIQTVFPAAYRAQILQRPLTLTEFRQAEPAAARSRGYLQLSSDLDAREGATFVNVLSTDESVHANLDRRVLSDHVELRLGSAIYAINTRVGRSFTVGSVTTDALVYAAGRGRVTALRATRVVSGGTTLHAERPVSLVRTDGRIAYSATGDVTVSFPLEQRPRDVLLNGRALRGWHHAPEPGLSMVLPSGSGVVEIRK